MIDSEVFRSLVVGFLVIAIIISNVLTLIMAYRVIKDPDEEQGVDYYFFSLGVADLLSVIIIAPISVHSMILGKFIYGDFMCRISGYLTASLWCVDVITLLWISADRYAFICLANKYSSGHWRTKCKCWIAVSWVTASFLCLGPYISFHISKYDTVVGLCVTNWTQVKAYFITISLLAIVPSLLTSIHNYGYIFFMKISVIQAQDLPYRKYSMITIENVQDSSHIISFALLMIFWLSWLPYIVLIADEHFFTKYLDAAHLKFVFVWIGFSHSIWKVFLFTFLSYKYRNALKSIFIKPKIITCEDESGCLASPENQMYERHLNSLIYQPSHD